MGNENHRDILREGVDFWNNWRSQNPNIQPDLSGSNVNKNLLKRINFRGCILSNVNFESAKLQHSDFSASDLTGANFSQANLEGSNLTNTFLVKSIFFSSNINNCIFNNSVFVDARINFTSAKYCDFSNCWFSSRYSHNRKGVGFLTAYFGLSGTNFTHSDLSYSDFKDSIFGDTNLADVNLSNVKNIDTCRYQQPCIIDHRTIVKSGELPKPFLWGCGLPDVLIDYYPSIIAKPFQFYACFISFSEPDDNFSKKIYTDLTKKGIMCWRWKEDAEYGKSLMSSIDNAIQTYDKLIVICSKSSLESPIVLREIERALQKEDDLKRMGKEPEVLFPIRLDNYVLNEWTHHRKADVTQKYIGDFSNWENDVIYNEKLEKLINDLKKE